MQPISAGYNAGDLAAYLIVGAESPDGGTLSYKWQESPDGTNWLDIFDASSDMYMPTTKLATGQIRQITFYRAVVTNWKGGLYPYTDLYPGSSLYPSGDGFRATAVSNAARIVSRACAVNEV